MPGGGQVGAHLDRAFTAARTDPVAAQLSTASRMADEPSKVEGEDDTIDGELSTSAL